MKAAIVACLCIVTVATVLALGPIPQDPGYHVFADQRTLLGVPNLLNVVSNAPFFLFGVMGLIVLRRGAPGVLPELRNAYATFFVSSALVAVGSSYYHLHPDDASLVWDRLPMTLAFMSFVAIVLGEHVSPALGRALLPVLLVVGVASVVYWRLTGDLRLYALVQFLPVLLIPLVFLLWPSRLTGVRLLWLVLATYGLAKLLELYDRPVYQGLGVSGHTLKHLAAATGVLLVLLAARIRAPRPLLSRSHQRTSG